jgi:phage shock protein E
MEIDGSKLDRMLKLHVSFVLIDLRSADDFNQSHIANAMNVPLAHFVKTLPERVPQKEAPIVIYNEDGNGMAPLLEKCEKMGYLNIVNLEGGYKSFVALTRS